MQAPLIRNPDFKERPDLYQHRLGFAAFELQQDQSGTIFDDILLCLDCEEVVLSFMLLTNCRVKTYSKP